jgi:PKD repeat protein
VLEEYKSILATGLGWLAVLSIAIPTGAKASVQIEEVAWMGTTANPNAEWIELYNPDTVAVDLSGYTLAATDGTPSIALSGTIAAGDYFILERTSDDTLPNVTADVLYTGGIANEGEILVLRNSNGTEQSRVDGSESWGIGGDNTTKDTLQRSGASWMTARPTPKARVVEAHVTPAAASSRNTSSGGSRPILVGRDEPEVRIEPKRKSAITLLIEPVPTALAGVPHTFESVVYDETDDVLMDGVVTWSFGDGATKVGRSVTHIYKHPGTYAAVASVEYSYLRTTLRTTAQVAVTVIEPLLWVGEVTPEYIALTNHTGNDIDLSGFVLSAQGKQFIVPAHTIVLSDATIRISNRISMLSPSTPESVRIYTPGGDRITYQPTAKISSEGEVMDMSEEPEVVFDDRDSHVLDASGEVTPVYQNASVIDQSSAAVSPLSQLANVAPAASDPISSTPLWWYILLLGGVIGVGVTAVLSLQHEQDITDARAREFTIIDEEDEKP